VHGAQRRLNLLSHRLDSAVNSVTCNSVRYKLRRISEITGLDLRDPEVRFQLQLALRILDVGSALGGAALQR
jgi:sugar diacid utilization regulator